MATRKKAPAAKTQKQKVKEFAEYLRDWTMNYNHDQDFPVLVNRLIASMPGGDEMEDIGYEGFSLGWKEIELLGELLSIVQDKGDVQDIATILIGRDEEEDLGEGRRVRQMPAGRRLNVSEGVRRSVRSSRRGK